MTWNIKLSNRTTFRNFKTSRSFFSRISDRIYPTPLTCGRKFVTDMQCKWLLHFQIRILNLRSNLELFLPRKFSCGQTGINSYLILYANCRQVILYSWFFNIAEHGCVECFKNDLVVETYLVSNKIYLYLLFICFIIYLYIILIVKIEYPYPINFIQWPD